MQHRKRFDNGNLTPQEFHEKYAFGPNERCCMCGTRRPSTRFVCMIPYDEIKRRDPDFALMEALDPARIAAMVVFLKHGKHIRVSTQDVCRECTPAAERIAAKAPSWAVVNIMRAPTGGPIMVGGGSNLPT